jgi:hypothetical protein
MATSISDAVKKELLATMRKVIPNAEILQYDTKNQMVEISGQSVSGSGSILLTTRGTFYRVGGGGVVRVSPQIMQTCEQLKAAIIVHDPKLGLKLKVARHDL